MITPAAAMANPVAVQSQPTPAAGAPPVALIVQLVGLWLVPFLLTATAALVAGRRR